MEEEEKKKIKAIIIIVVILLVILIILSLIVKTDKNKEKYLNAKDYIVEKATSHTTKKGKMPFINLKGEEIEKINKEIMTKYYSVVYDDFDEFKYEYTTYKDILSILIVVTYGNEREYGTIEYYSYNINLKENKVLNNQELCAYLNIDSSKIKEQISLKHKDFYEKDKLKKEISYEEYIETINYKEENNKIVIKDNSLYSYNVLTFTQSLMTYSGNINEIKLIELN